MQKVIVFLLNNVGPFLSLLVCKSWSDKTCKFFYGEADRGSKGAYRFNSYMPVMASTA